LRAIVKIYQHAANKLYLYTHPPKTLRILPLRIERLSSPGATELDQQDEVHLVTTTNPTIRFVKYAAKLAGSIGSGFEFDISKARPNIHTARQRA
jgi:hypothetical protein